MPSIDMKKERLIKGINILDLFVECKLSESKGEVRRLIRQGGCSINDKKIIDEKALINSSYITNKGIILKSGKKKVLRVKVI